MLMHSGVKLEAGDVAAIAIHREEREAAEQVLTALGWTPEPAASSEAAPA